MVEDALKSTRTLHRLIMTVSLVTLVFALSVSLPEDKIKLKAAIDGLLEIDFLAYDSFVDEQVKAAVETELQPISSGAAKRFADGKFLVFGLDYLAGTLLKPLHVGKLLPKQLLLAEMSNATLSKLRAINGLSLGKNVQIVIPETDGLLTEIESYLKENERAGQRVDTIRYSIDSFDFTAESFLPTEKVFAGLYFELVDKIQRGGAPTFNANFQGRVADLPLCQLSQLALDVSMWLRRRHLQNAHEVLLVHHLRPLHEGVQVV